MPQWPLRKRKKRRQRETENGTAGGGGTGLIDSLVKGDNWMDMLKGFNRALDYIEDNLDGQIDLKEVAKKGLQF